MEDDRARRRQRPVEVECLRALDRLRLKASLEDEELARRRTAVYRISEELELVHPGPAVLRRATQPLPTPVGTLDAIHLATALQWQESRGRDILMATHDHGLARAARASGLHVIGE